ncbi:retrovirus-related pol polyprotein from transposon TNT 1-94, partial [Tanacetum coccineum]
MSSGMFPPYSCATVLSSQINILNNPVPLEFLKDVKFRDATDNYIRPLLTREFLNCSLNFLLLVITMARQLVDMPKGLAAGSQRELECIKAAIYAIPSMFNAIRCMSSKLFVGGLSYQTDDHSLKEAFSSFGEVTDGENMAPILVSNHRVSEDHRGFLVPIVIRILVPKVRNLKKLASRKTASVRRRKAIIGYLAELDINELPLFFNSRVILDKESGRSRGFGFVNYDTNKAANEAMTTMDVQELNGQSIRVSLATELPPRQGGFGGGGGGYNCNFNDTGDDWSIMNSIIIWFDNHGWGFMERGFLDNSVKKKKEGGSKEVDGLSQVLGHLARRVKNIEGKPMMPKGILKKVMRNVAADTQDVVVPLNDVNNANMDESRSMKNKEDANLVKGDTTAVIAKSCSLADSHGNKDPSIAATSNEDLPKIACSFANVVLPKDSFSKVHVRTLINEEKIESFDCVFPKAAAAKVKSRYENSIVGFFVGKDPSFPVVQQYVS